MPSRKKQKTASKSGKRASKQKTAPRPKLRGTFEEWLDILAGCATEAERKAFVFESLKGKDTLHIFGRYFFPHIISGDYETPESHLDLIAFMASPEDGAGIFPRGFAKT